MAFTEDQNVFPNNIAVVLFNALSSLDSDVQVFRRALRATDPTQCIGIVPADWTPSPNSEEIGNVEPTLQRYRFGIQGFIKDADPLRGLAVHAVMAQAIRGVLVRDRVTRGNLGALRVNGADGSIERAQQWNITRQVYLSNEVQGQFLFLSTAEFWLETEKV